MTATYATPKSFAIVIPTPWNVPAPWSADVNLMVQGFLDCGHEAVLVCPEGSDLTGTAIEPARIQVVPRHNMASAEFWQTLNVNAALIFTWMGRPDVVIAARKAGLFVVSLSDSDGLQGVRVHPKATLERMICPMPTWLGKLRACWYWGKKVVYLHWREEEAFVQTFRAADITTVQMSEGKPHLQRFFDARHCSDSEAKIQVIPFPVCAEALHGSVGLKQNHLVAVGRWDDPQKNAQLLMRSLREYLQQSPDTTVTLIGNGGETVFAPLLRAYTQVRYCGVLPRSEVMRVLQTARTILFTSRWEGMPNALHEALAMGCSFVGTDIPATRSVFKAGPFGTLATNSRPHVFADALQAEHLAWQNGERNPLEIAAFWRTRLSPRSTAQQYVDLLVESGGCEQRLLPGVSQHPS